MADSVVAFGFHGTSYAAAKNIAAKGFFLSTNSYDWLGDGVYFFQDAEERARSWARQYHPAGWAVLRVEIRLDTCMDLLDGKWFSVLRESYDGILEMSRVNSIELPRQNGLLRGLDRDVINYSVRVLKERGINIGSVRAAFEEGAPAFPGSGLMDQAHIQIAVRDTNLIENVIVVDQGGEECRTQIEH